MPRDLVHAYRILHDARDDHNENTQDLHPTLAWRAALAVEHLWARHGPRCITVESAVRTRAEQIYLWEGYQAKLRGEAWAQHFNLAANPYRIVGETPVGIVRGSYHMQQDDGHGHAIDFTRPGNKIPWSTAHAAFDKFGLWHGVRGEPWHVQAVLSSGWVKGPTPPTTTTQGDEDMAQIYALFNGWIPTVCYLDYAGGFRSVSVATVFEGVKDSAGQTVIPPWNTTHKVTPCSEGQLASLRASARETNVLFDEGAKDAPVTAKFWDVCPYTPRPVVRETGGGATRTQVEQIVDAAHTMTKSLVSTEANKTRSKVNSETEEVKAAIAAVAAGGGDCITNEEMAGILRSLADDILAE